MLFEQTLIPGVVEVRPQPQSDERGFFARLYCPLEFAHAGALFNSTQINLSRNAEAFTLRGLHYQDAPHAEAKLVRAVRGRIFDVVVDLRPDSQTYRFWIGFILDEKCANALLIPEGCAHGFMTMTPDADVMYQMSRIHDPGHAKGIRWNDPAIGITWPAEPLVISAADRAWPLLD